MKSTISKEFVAKWREAEQAKKILDAAQKEYGDKGNKYSAAQDARDRARSAYYQAIEKLKEMLP